MMEQVVGGQLDRPLRLVEGVEQLFQQVGVGTVGGRQPHNAIGRRGQPEGHVAQQDALAHARRPVEFKRLGSARRLAGRVHLFAPAE